MKNYTLKLYKTNGEIETVRTRKKRRFLRILRTINWQNSIKKAYIKVSYGKKLDVYSKLSEFYNDGYYETKGELLEIFKYFDGED